MKSILLCCVLMLLEMSALAATPKNVTYKSGNDTVHGILYTPAGKGPFPGIVVVHEWWGLNDWVKEQASKLADQGYVTLAIDLYRGKVATTPNEAHEIMRSVPEDRAKRDLQAAFEVLETQPDVKKDRIGAIGWCMGGGYALELALDEPTLGADAINYGHLATDPEALKKINAPILGLFGAPGSRHYPRRLKKFEAHMDQTGEKDRCHHLFRRRSRLRKPQQQRRISRRRCADAWNRIV